MARAAPPAGSGGASSSSGAAAAAAPARARSESAARETREVRPIEELIASRAIRLSQHCKTLLDRLSDKTVGGDRNAKILHRQIHNMMIRAVQFDRNVGPKTPINKLIKTLTGPHSDPNEIANIWEQTMRELDLQELPDDFVNSTPVEPRGRGRGRSRSERRG